MTDSMETEDALERLRKECAEISYLEIQKFFAKGVILVVHKEVNLIDVAYKIHQDDADTIGQLMDKGRLVRAHDAHAKRWHEEKTQFNAVTVAPWLLVQES
ncbi:DUF2288 family protein [Marinicella sp. W31]|uniref:DUF2288 family protein n=1 Tax=Marinicella sp. W31 TaxID=3023713 RepID=UPI003757EBD7